MKKRTCLIIIICAVLLIMAIVVFLKIRTKPTISYDKAVLLNIIFPQIMSGLIKNLHIGNILFKLHFQTEYLL